MDEEGRRRQRSFPARCRLRSIAILAATTSSATTSSRLAKAQFGSGWAWLAVKNGKLEIMKTPNAENPLVHGATPILTVDVWEHAYYIDYRNARPKFLEAFVDHLINWEYVEEKLQQAGVTAANAMGWAFAQPQTPACAPVISSPFSREFIVF